MSDEVVPEAESTGTTVRLWYVDNECDSLRRDETRSVLTRRFALYLSEYPETKIIFDGVPLSVEGLIDFKKTYPLPPLAIGEASPGSVTVIEWVFRLDNRKLYLCSPSGFSFHDMPLKLHAPGMNYTAYFRSDQVKDWMDTGRLTTQELDPQITEVLDLVRGHVRAHVRQRQAEAAKDVVAEWKDQDIYPYADDETGPLSEAERQVFDIVAVHVDAIHETFSDTDPETKRLTLALIRRALEGESDQPVEVAQELLRPERGRAAGVHRPASADNA